MSALEWPRPISMATSRSRSVSAVELLGGGGAPAVGLVVGEMFDEGADHGRGQHRFAAGDGVDGVDDVGGCGVFEEEAAGSGAQGGEHVVVEMERGQHDDVGGSGQLVEVFGGGDPVHVGHPDVHQHDVGLQRRRLR